MINMIKKLGNYLTGKRAEESIDEVIDRELRAIPVLYSKKDLANFAQAYIDKNPAEAEIIGNFMCEWEKVSG